MSTLSAEPLVGLKQGDRLDAETDNVAFQPNPSWV